MTLQNWSQDFVQNSHPTRELLIEAVIDLMKNVRLEEITSELVIEVSGISKGSLYHHFNDFPELLEFAYVEVFARLATIQLTAFENMLESFKTREDFLKGNRKISHGNKAPEIASLRLARVTAIAMAMNSPRMAKMLGKVQDEVTDWITRLFLQVQEKGWCRKDFDPRTFAVFIQAYQVGSVINLLTPQRMDPEAWIDLIDEIWESVIFQQA